MHNTISITHIIHVASEEPKNRKIFLLEKIHLFLKRIRAERRDLVNYYLNDIGLFPGKNEILIKLYFKQARKSTKQDNRTNKADKLIDLRDYFCNFSG